MRPARRRWRESAMLTSDVIAAVERGEEVSAGPTAASAGDGNR